MTHIIDIAKGVQQVRQKARIKQLPEPVNKRSREPATAEINVYIGQPVVRHRGKGKEPERGTVQDVRGDKGTVIIVGVGWHDSISGGCGYDKLLRCRLNGDGSYGVQHKVDGKWCYRTSMKKRHRDSWVPVGDNGEPDFL
jgi:hypothetical protein